jgi:acyl-coenzyme A synthetase/AMP-(fatty) acid ligase
MIVLPWMARQRPRVQPWTSLLAETDSKPVRVTPDVEAPAVLLTTSRTTGQPKFVIHTKTTRRRPSNNLFV